MRVISIRGIDVDVRWVAANTAWQVAVLCLWVPVAVSLLRLRRRHRKKHTRPAMVIRWAHAVAMLVCLTISGIDVNNVYFEWFRPFNFFFFNQYALTFANLCIYYFYGHVEAYLATTNQFLTRRQLVPTARKYTMAFNLLVSEAIVIATFAAQRAFLTSLLYQFVAVQILVMGPVLVAIVVLVTKSVLRLQQVAKDTRRNDAAVLSSANYLRAFQRWAICSACLAIAFGVSISVLLSPAFKRDQNLPYSSLDGWAGAIGITQSMNLPYSSLDGWGNRNHAGEFRTTSLFLLNWGCLAGEVFVIWLHCIPSSSSASKTSSGLTSKSSRRRKGGSSGSGANRSSFVGRKSRGSTALASTTASSVGSNTGTGVGSGSTTGAAAGTGSTNTAVACTGSTTTAVDTGSTTSAVDSKSTTTVAGTRSCSIVISSCESMNSEMAAVV